MGKPPAFDPQRHHRRSLRKRHHDYASPGRYFVTFCTKDRYPWLGMVRESKVVLNANGQIAYEHWLAISGHYGHVMTHAFAIMPDHIHGVIELTAPPPRIATPVAAGQRPLGPAPGSLGAIVGSYRAGIVREMNRTRKVPIHGLWQRGYHDIIIWNDQMMERMIGYIQRHPTIVLN